MNSEKNTRDLPYYEKLGFDNFESWSANDIEQFLIFDFLDINTKIGQKEVKETAYSDWQFSNHKYNKHKLVVDFFDRFFLELCRKEKKNNNPKILFQGLKYRYIVSGIKKKCNLSLIAQNGKDRLFALANSLGYISTNKLFFYVCEYLNDKNVQHLHKMLKELENDLISVRPDYIVLSGDFTPIQRAIVLVSKRLGIPTLEIQHGIYNSYHPLVTGIVADYVLVWGKYFKDLYLDKGCKTAEKVYILGYPYQTKKKETISRKKGKHIVCYLGTDFERYDKKLLGVKLNTVRGLLKICEGAGFEFIYRPHPHEDTSFLRESMPNLKISNKKEKLEEAFEKADIFISFNSTALIQASMAGKICFQLMDFPVYVDNFESLGICDKSFKTIERLEDHFKSLANKPNVNRFKAEFNSDYINTKHNPVEHFLDIIDKIERKTR